MFDVAVKFWALHVGTAVADAGVVANAGKKNVTTSARPSRTRKGREKVTIP
jgi:hypothetical protein